MRDIFIPFTDVSVGDVVLMFLAIGCGLLVRITLGLAKQQWARTYSNTLTYLLLPVVGLIIVQVISSSIALSLGMIGALSIVRFRHPVKSPLELVIFFLLLTVGVALSSKTWLGIALTLISCALILGVTWFQQRRIMAGQNPFPNSPGDGTPQFLLEITAKQAVELGSLKASLVFMAENLEERHYTYKLAFSSRVEADAARDQLGKVNGITMIAGSFP